MLVLETNLEKLYNKEARKDLYITQRSSTGRHVTEWLVRSPPRTIRALLCCELMSPTKQIRNALAVPLLRILKRSGLATVEYF